MNSDSSAKSLTGVWQGTYTYSSGLKPEPFIATLIEAGHSLSGSTHEPGAHRDGRPVTLYASLVGARSGSFASFTKTYDGTGGWDHSIEYSGTVNGDATEIEGEWTFPGQWAGRFLMVRQGNAKQELKRRAVEKV